MARIFFILSALATLLPVLAQTSSGLPKAAATSLAGDLQKRIDKAIADLGADQWKTREEAEETLRSIGLPAMPALRQALSSPDAEVAHRARRCLDSIKFGLASDTPSDIVALVDSFRSGNIPKDTLISSLLGKGQPGVKVLLAIWTAEPEDRQFARAIATAAGKILPVILEQDQLDRADDLLAEMARSDSASNESGRHYAAWSALRGTTTQAIGKLQIWTLVEDHRGEAKAAWRVLAYLHRANGDLAKAQDAARNSGDAELLKAILFERSDWKSLVPLKLAEPELAPSVGASAQIERLGYTATWHRLAGDAAAFGQDCDNIHKFVGENPQQAFFGVEAMLVNERPEDALALMAGADNSALAFEFLAGQMDYARAFALLDKAPPDKSDNMNLYLAAARLQAHMGSADEAARTLKGLEGVAGDNPDLNSRLQAARKELFPSKAERIEFRYRGLFPAPLRVPLDLLGPVNDENLDTLDALLGGRASDSQIQQMLNTLRASSPAEKPARYPAAIAILRANKQSDQALTIAKTYAEMGVQDAARAKFLGDFYLQVGQYALAAEHYRARFDAAGRTLGPALGSCVDRYLLGLALSKSGQAQEGEKLMQQAWLVTWQEDSLRNDLLDEFRRRGLREPYRRLLEIQQRCCQFRSYPWQVATMRMADELAQEGKFFEAAAAREHLRLGWLDLNVFAGSVDRYLGVAGKLHADRARGHLAQKQFAQALEEARLCQKLNPSDIDVIIDAARALDRAGQKDQAQALMEKTRDITAAAIERFPGSAELRNRQAWLLVRCRRQLDLALEQASKAAELEKDNPAVLDTLAEVHFQRGQQAKAVELGQRCVELAGQEQYYRRQLDRFRQGRPDQDIPSRP
jgi:hypothetical protein